MKRKILVISPVATHPLNSGNRVRIYYFLSHLKKMGHEIHFLYIEQDIGWGGADVNAMENCWDGYYQMPYFFPQEREDGSSFVQRLINRGGRVAFRIIEKLRLFQLQRFVNKIYLLLFKKRFHTYLLDDWYDESLSKGIKEVSKRIDPDVVIVEYIAFSKVLELFSKKVLKVLDTHDIFTQRNENLLKHDMEPTGWFSATLEEEKRALNRSDIIIAMQDKDREFFSKLTKKKIVTIGHISPLCKTLHDNSSKNKMLFIGDCSPKNIKAVENFINNIFPLVKEKLPQAEFLIAGKICDFVKNKNESFIKLRKIDNIEDVYSMVGVVVNPEIFGTGLSIKNIEALSYSKPLVTTSVGARGLEEGINRAFLVADDPEQFAQSIVSIFTENKLYQMLVDNAYEYAQRYNQKAFNTLSNCLTSYEK